MRSPAAKMTIRRMPWLPPECQRQADRREEKQEIGRAGQEQRIAQALQDDRQHRFRGSEDPQPGPCLSRLPPVEGQAIAKPAETAGKKGLVQTGSFFHLPPGLLQDLEPLLHRDVLHAPRQDEDAIVDALVKDVVDIAPIVGGQNGQEDTHHDRHR
jgi:hypothetical protein